MSTTIEIEGVDYPIGDVVAGYIAALELNIEDHKGFIDRQSDRLAASRREANDLRQRMAVMNG